jgi:hypothetical protein
MDPVLEKSRMQVKNHNVLMDVNLDIQALTANKHAKAKIALETNATIKMENALMDAKTASSTMKVKRTVQASALQLAKMESALQVVLGNAT